MRYWIGAICLAVAAGLIIKGLRHRRQILSLATREALAAQHAAASSDPRSMSALGEIGRPLVLFFVGWLAVKAGLLYLLFHAGRWLSIADLAGFYALLYAYGVHLTLHTRYRMEDAIVIRGAAPAYPAIARSALE